MHLTATVELHFMDFQEALIKYGTTQDDSYNINETSFQIGYIGGQIVITHLNTKAVYLSVSAYGRCRNGSTLAKR